MSKKVTVEFDIKKIVNNRGTSKSSLVDSIDVFMEIDSTIGVPLYRDKPSEKPRIGYCTNPKQGRKIVRPLRDVFLVDEADQSYKLQLQRNDDFFAITRNIAEVILESGGFYRPSKRPRFNRKNIDLEVKYRYREGYGEDKRMLMEF